MNKRVFSVEVEETAGRFHSQYTDPVSPRDQIGCSLQTRLLAFGAILMFPWICQCAFGTDHFVSPFGGNVPPFTDWSSAATNIQDAIDAASVSDVVWVTNGVYAAGGKVMAGDLTNRVVLDKALTVQSVNGPLVTTIQGPVVPPGSQAVRGAWLTNGAVLQGFTIQGGATRPVGDATLTAGGGVWCASSNAFVFNCLVVSNSAAPLGGDGGGAYQGTLMNCWLYGNYASYGGGAYLSSLYNCTLLQNRSSAVGTAGTYNCPMVNCIPVLNSSGNYWQGTQTYCCTTPLPPGVGNIGADPQLMPDGIHIANTSPCRGAGTNLAVGTDIDGQPWANPPSIGCDESSPIPVAYGAPVLRLTPDPAGFTLTAPVVDAGRDPAPG